MCRNSALKKYFTRIFRGNKCKSFCGCKSWLITHGCGCGNLIAAKLPAKKDVKSKSKEVAAVAAEAAAVVTESAVMKK